MGKHWDYQIARDQLTSIMQMHGFGKNGTKTYTILKDKPEGWPSTVDFTEVKHPSFMRVDQINCAIESILRYHGIDPYTYHRTDGIEKSNMDMVENFVEFDKKFKKENNYYSVKEKADSLISSPQSLLKTCFCKIRCPEKCNFKKEAIEDDLMQDSEDMSFSQDDVLDSSDDSDNEIDYDEDVYNADNDMNMEENTTYRFNMKEYGEILY